MDKSYLYDTDGRFKGDKSIDNIGFWKRKAGIFREKAGFIGNIMQRACMEKRPGTFQARKGSFGRSKEDMHLKPHGYSLSVVWISGLRR